MKIITLKFSIFFTVLFIFKSTLLLNAQEPIVIGHKMSVYSKILQEEREYWVSLPKSYNDTVYTQKQYPVCYFFDGDSHFENLVAQRNRLSRGFYASMPEVILVGILQKKRTRELTPSQSSGMEKGKHSNFSTGGENSVFMDFIEDDLKALIDSTYRTNGYEILIGHSFGGLAVVNTLINFPERYNAFVAIDPSMWWDNKRLLNSVDSLWKPENYVLKTLVLAKAKAKGTGSDDHHHNAILSFQEKLIELSENGGLHYTYFHYPNENHGSVVVPAEYDALRFIFSGYQLAVKKAMKSPELIDDHYKKISKSLGYRIIPDEKMLDELAQICVKREFVAQAKEILYKNTFFYPKSDHAKMRYQNFDIKSTKEKNQ